jgi:hypothetical protein
VFLVSNPQNKYSQIPMKKLLLILAVAATGLTGASAQNILVNPNFNQGANNLAGYEAYAAWSKGTAYFDSPWDLADAPVVANGSGTAVFSMNTGLATRDPFWSGANQVMSFQQNFWTPDNNAGVTPTRNLYSQELTFTGFAQVSQAYASGNLGQVFIQFLDFSYNSVAFVAADVSSLPSSGAFELKATAPASGLNIIQIGFRNSGTEGTAGRMTVSQPSFTAVPEPSTYALLALGAAGFGAHLVRRRRR